MKTLRYTIDIPVEIAASDPAVISQVNASQASRYGPLLRAAQYLNHAVHRYDQALHTKDEKRALQSVLVNARSLSSALKDLSKEV